MGTLSTKKFIKNNAGVLTEEAALTTSAGAGDADKLPALNASGILDDTIINASAASAANKVVKQTAGGIITPAVLNAAAEAAAACDAAKMVQLYGTGRIDSTMMPAGIGADTASITASENLSAGDFVNIHNATGVKVRKADATTAGKEAHGFVLGAITSGNPGTVYFEGTNTAVNGATPGVAYLATTAGGFTATAPSGSGNAVHRGGLTCTPRQARLALQQAGLLAAVEAWIARADEATRIEWEFASEIRRDWPAILACAVGLGLGDEQMDGLFALAGTL